MEFNFSSESRAKIVRKLRKDFQRNHEDLFESYMDDNEHAFNTWLDLKHWRAGVELQIRKEKRAIARLRKAYQNALEDLQHLVPDLNILVTDILDSRDQLEPKLQRYERLNEKGTYGRPGFKSPVGRHIELLKRKLAVDSVGAYRRHFEGARGIRPVIRAVWQSYRDDKAPEMPALTMLSKPLLDSAISWWDNWGNIFPHPWGPLLDK